MPNDFAEIQRQMRLACAPPAGHPDASERRCAACSRPFWAWKGKSHARCADCAASRARSVRAAFAAKYARARV